MYSFSNSIKTEGNNTECDLLGLPLDFPDAIPSFLQVRRYAGRNKGIKFFFP